ncbi:hypothetical protein [Nostoc sp.]|uniref:hypothetical protein n=1 Tax=Nostoc sp. TaxID=1180 RepID=UPI002FEF99BA
MKQTSQILFPSSLFLESDWDAFSEGVAAGIALKLDFQYHFYTSTARALEDTSLFVIHITHSHDALTLSGLKPLRFY